MPYACRQIPSLAPSEPFDCRNIRSGITSGRPDVSSASTLLISPMNNRRSMTPSTQKANDARRRTPSTTRVVRLDTPVRQVHPYSRPETPDEEVLNDAIRRGVGLNLDSSQSDLEYYIRADSHNLLPLELWSAYEYGAL